MSRFSEAVSKEKLKEWLDIQSNAYKTRALFDAWDIDASERVCSIDYCDGIHVKGVINIAEVLACRVMISERTSEEASPYFHQISLLYNDVVFFECLTDEAFSEVLPRIELLNQRVIAEEVLNEN